MSIHTPKFIRKKLNEGYKPFYNGHKARRGIFQDRNLAITVDDQYFLALGEKLADKPKTKEQMAILFNAARDIQWAAMLEAGRDRKKSDLVETAIKANLERINGMIDTLGLPDDWKQFIKNNIYLTFNRISAGLDQKKWSTFIFVQLASRIGTPTNKKMITRNLCLTSSWGKPCWA